MRLEKEYHSFVQTFSQKLYEAKKDGYTNFVFLCIGTDRITGDSFGPLVGEKLCQKIETSGRMKQVKVFGTLEQTLCHHQMKEVFKQINANYQNPYIIAIDSAMAKSEDVGKVLVSNQGLLMGKAMNKEHKRVGNISVKGVVAIDRKIPKVNFAILQNTPLHLVMKLADYTTNGIYEAISFS